MVYRGKIRKRHSMQAPDFVPEGNNTVPKLQLVKMPENVPLPNQTENDEEASQERGKPDKLSSFLFSRFPSLERASKHIHLDDIILAGLIILLLDEGTEDYYLILILAYLLLSDLELFDLFT